MSQKAQSKTTKFAWFLLLVGAFFLVRNITTTAASLSDNPGTSFMELFFTATDSSGEVFAGFVLFIWAPFVLLPLGALLLWLGARKPQQQASA
ncbi:hypothetical protein [Lysinibacter cavernae]|uniref:Membrane-bound ClpP family serine protease n=1 Tax=Lysinibacter cavernae TaxID=1640652 RepID=A0A7X5R0W3_9MICO|nr:hypothetical protein [Lysinibacter cavernae]NIH53640.1 membrane-bound ClpP family serine protease [Lysinibacter cavernae]